MELSEIQTKFDYLARHGITVSLVYGPCGKGGEILYSVDVLTRDCRSFDRPYAARSFTQAVDIVLIECRERGWLPSLT